MDNDRIKLCTNKEVVDVNTILPSIDMLITDWCSIEHDYILLNRPILYIPYDYHDFEKNNGFSTQMQKNEENGLCRGHDPHSFKPWSSRLLAQPPLGPKIPKKNCKKMNKELPFGAFYIGNPIGSGE